MENSKHFSELAAPQAVANLMNSVALSDKEKRELNRNLANLVRKYFRGQIKAQRDIHNEPYIPRKRKSGMSDKAYRFFDEKDRATHAKRRKHGNLMFTGLAKSLKTFADKESFAVGFTGVAGIVAEKHNKGAYVEYGYRIKSWFNTRTNRFEGGLKRKGVYKLPKRAMIGWNNELESLVMNEIMKAMEPK